MKRARSIQLGMLPDVPTIPGLDFHVHYSACDELGGDFYDFVDVGPFELGIVVADVSGHGLDAALLMASAKKTVQIHGRGRRSPAETLQVVCEDLAAELPTNSFITMFYGVLDLRSFELTYASAGHNPPILVNPQRSETLSTLTAKGVVIGASMKKLIATTLQEETIRLQEGDSLVIHTDGLTEAMSPEREEYGEERLHKLLLSDTDCSAARLVATINDELVDHLDGAEPSDDLTILAVRCIEMATDDDEIKLDADEQTLPGNLSVNHRTILGRQHELKKVGQLLEESACVGVTGPGGMGKSLLAREYTRQQVQFYGGGVWTVDCADCTDLETVAVRIAEVLEVPLDDEPVESLGEVLSFRRNTALILEDVDRANLDMRALSKWASFENVVHLITTSINAPKGVADCQLSGLRAPKRSDRRGLDVPKAMQFPSVQLFANFAEGADFEFEVNSDNVREIAEICDELHGLPLAIELAAKHITDLNPERICRALKSHSAKISVLSQAGIDTSEIFRTVQWSFDLLAEAEQDVVLQLSIFRHGFFVENTERVVDHPRLLDVLESLLSRGVLRREETPYGSRLSIYGPMGEYARTQRREKFTAEKRAKLRTRYVGYFADFAKYWFRVFNRLEDAETFTESECLDRIQYEYENLKDVHGRSLKSMPEVASHCALCAVAMLSQRSGAGRGAKFLDDCIEVLPDTPADLRVLLLTWRARLYRDVSETRTAIDLAQEAVEMTDELPTTRENVEALLRHAMLLCMSGELDAALSESELVLNQAKAVDNKVVYLTAMAEIAAIGRMKGKLDEAVEPLEKVLELADELNSDISRVTAHTRLGTAYHKMGKVDEALEQAELFGEASKRLGNKVGVAGSYNNRANIYLLKKDYKEAQRLYEKASRALERLGHSHGVMVIKCNCTGLSMHTGDYRAAREMLDSVMPLIVKKGVEDTQRRAYYMDGILSYHEANYRQSHDQFIKVHQQQLKRAEYSRAYHVPHTIGLMGLLDGDRSAPEKWFSFIDQSDQSNWRPIEKLCVAVTEAWTALILKAPDDELQAAETKLDEIFAEHTELAEQADIEFQFVFGLVYDYYFARKEDSMKVKVRCKYCKKKYSGAKGKIVGLKSCTHCGHKPFVWDRVEE
ncbi:MAG: SpoIIE family protein phosphatase [Planctomycetota bacterium]|jgi:predicted ATPase